jgi:hypothetical protein
MMGSIGFVLIVLGATGFASVFGWSGLLQFLLFATIIGLLIHARSLRHI